MAALLEAHGVTQIFGDPKKGALPALDNFSFSISDDEPSFTSVVGESGSGKTTLARMLLGFLNPTTGAVKFHGADLHKVSGATQRQFRREVQAIFQDPFEVYNPFYKVDHLLEVPIRKFKLAGSRAQARSMMEDALRTVGLCPEDTLGRYPHQLSGGQRQRITVARALLLKPRLIVADEPVSMVDASLRATILESLRKLHEDFKISFLYITHDLTTAYQVSDNIIVLYRGTIAETGDVDHVIKDPQHPYTQLLISSIPQPDPDRRWGGEIAAPSRPEAEAPAQRGCPFADRCPHVMQICRETPPPLFRTDEHRAVSCYLYRDAPQLPAGTINQVFRSRTTTTAPPSRATATVETRQG
jgi:peptide/nickel transport system ATP-binding protein